MTPSKPTDGIFHLASMILGLSIAALATSGCVGAGGRIGYRTTVQKDVDEEFKSTSRGVYGGPVVDLAIHEHASSRNVRPLYMGIQYAFNFAGGSSRNFQTVLPVVGLFSRAMYFGNEDEVSFATTLGGFLGAGLDIQQRQVSFHTALCGGTFSQYQGYICGRFSTRGWYGFDFNSSFAPLTTIVDTYQFIKDFEVRGLYYMG